MLFFFEKVIFLLTSLPAKPIKDCRASFNPLVLAIHLKDTLSMCDLLVDTEH